MSLCAGSMKRTPSRSFVAAAFGLLLMGGCNTYQYSPFNWMPPAPVRGPSEAEKPGRVRLDYFAGRSREDGERAARVVWLIQDVLNSSEFRCQVLNFDHTKPEDDRADLCSEDPKRRELTGEGKLFLDAADQEGAPPKQVSSAEVWQKLRAGSERKHAQAGAPFIDEPGVVNLDLRLKVTGCAYGVTNDFRTETTRRAFDRFNNYQLAGHWLHEYTHRLGYNDRGGEERSPVLVSYRIGFLACVEAGRLTAHEHPKEKYREKCKSTMLGNGEE